MKHMGMSHRWSGWPGAWCLDCGMEDPMEIALADAHYDPYTETWVSPEVEARYRAEYPRECPHAGEGLCDPYRKNKGAGG